MVKRIAILISAGVLLVALLAATATAMPGTGKGKGKGKGPAQVTYNFKGTVAETTTESTDPTTGETVGSDSITVDVERSNNAARSFVGQQVTFAVGDATKIEVNDQEGASLDQISQGDEVVVQSKATPNTTSGFVARIISAESPEDDD